MTMLERLKKTLLGWATNYSRIRNLTKRYIKECNHYIHGRWKGICRTRDIKNNTKRYILFLVNVAVTGIIIEYIVTHRNFMSYGMFTAVIMYYMKWFKKLIVTSEVDSIDKL